MSPDELRRRLRVYVVIDPRFSQLDPCTLTRQCIAGGATAIQLRSKDTADRETLRLAVQMRSLVAGTSVLLFINDRLDIALASGAGGVHLGDDDLPLKVAQALAGPSFLLGYSPGALYQAATARENGASYLGAGPVFGTTSKEDAGPAIGLKEVARYAEVSGLPVVGIGGINAANARSVIDAGACGVAVMSAVLSAPDPQKATAEIAASLLEPASPGPR